MVSSLNPFVTCMVVLHTTIIPNMDISDLVSFSDLKDIVVLANEEQLKSLYASLWKLHTNTTDYFFNAIHDRKGGSINGW